MKGKENDTPHEQQQQQPHYNPWYSMLSCRLLGFIGGAGCHASADHEEVRNCVRPVISSHRLSAERRFSESSMHSIRCEYCFFCHIAATWLQGCLALPYPLSSLSTWPHACS